VVINNAATTTTSSASVFSTESYVLTLTNASQSEIDTLGASEIIVQQFKAERAWQISNCYQFQKSFHPKSTD
jgi:hypothetical protein